MFSASQREHAVKRSHKPVKDCRGETEAINISSLWELQTDTTHAGFNLGHLSLRVI